MKPEHIRELVDRYNSGEATPQDLKTIESLLKRDQLDLGDLQQLDSLDQKIMHLASPDPSAELDDRFYATLAQEKKKARKFRMESWFVFPPTVRKFAFASITFTLGVMAGYFLLQRPAAKDQDLADVKSEVIALKEMMMLSLLEKESATERLRAVSLSQELDQASQKVTSALLKTLNQDQNINVRLAALEALESYSSDGEVRKQLILSISNQESPLVQIALADLMASLQEKSSVSEFEKLLKNENTPKEVKSKIRERIEVLI